MALTHRSQARHQVEGSIVTRKSRLDFRLDDERLVGERKGQRIIDIPIANIRSATSVDVLRGTKLRYQPFRGRILRLEFTASGKRHLLGIPMPDPVPWIAAIDAARR